MKNFVEDVITLEAKIVRGGLEMGAGCSQTERELKGMYAEAEKMLLAKRKRDKAESVVGSSITNYRVIEAVVL